MTRLTTFPSLTAIVRRVIILNISIKKSTITLSRNGIRTSYNIACVKEQGSFRQDTAWDYKTDKKDYK